MSNKNIQLAAPKNSVENLERKVNNIVSMSKSKEVILHGTKIKSQDIICGKYYCRVSSCDCQSFRPALVSTHCRCGHDAGDHGYPYYNKMLCTDSFTAAILNK
jgi:hypothetical protein